MFCMSFNFVGIVENEAVMGLAVKPQSILHKALSLAKPKPRKSYTDGSITIITEEEAGGSRASEMFKLDAEKESLIFNRPEDTSCQSGNCSSSEDESSTQLSVVYSTDDAHNMLLPSGSMASKNF
jgi:hypothetical protein